MPKGFLHLDYEGEPQYRVDVTHFVLRESELVFDFVGSNEGAQYSGSCKLDRKSDTFEGKATYSYPGEAETYSARVTLTLEQDDDDYIASGTWMDEDDIDSYDLSGEFLGNGS